MNLRSLWKLLMVSVLAMLVVGCKPIASFTVSPQPVKAGIEATFDGSGSMVDPTVKNNVAVSYAWTFGDGSTATGKVVKHTYAAAGNYSVKLSVTDKAGEVGTLTETVKVQVGTVVPPVVTNTVKVSVQIAGGVPLVGADVSVGAITAVSDANGVATLVGVPVGANRVVRVSKAGYVPQSFVQTVAAGTVAQQALGQLLPVKESLSIAQIELAQKIDARTLGASVTLPAAALVLEGTTTPATGAVTLRLTPWDIRANDLQAMPGNGRARDAAGNQFDLISAGMMTVNFVDGQGRALQVAQGKTADIQMDLPAASIGGNALAVGSTIPLWHFSESEGLWVQEGNGTVVASSTSAVGLAVKATVSHFSTWNWDFKWENGGTVQLSCQDSTGQLVGCSVMADVTLPDGSRFTRANTISASVFTVYNMPSSGSITWTATDASGSVGTVVSGTSGVVSILFGPPKTRNFVQCKLLDGTASACSVTMNAPLQDGSVRSIKYSLPAEGGQINTAVDTVGPIQWVANSPMYLNAAGDLMVAQGEAASGVNEAVNIALTPQAVAASKRLRLACDPVADVFDGTLDAPSGTEALASCDISLSMYDPEGPGIVLELGSGLAAPRLVSLPRPVSPNAYVSIPVVGTTVSGKLVSAYVTYPYGDLTDNQLISVRLSSYINVPVTVQ